MQKWTATALLALGTLAAAQDETTHPFVAPGSGDVRSPCPGLNSLANHGFLPHSGKNITLQDFQVALKDGLNVGHDFSTTIGELGVLANPNILIPNVNLDQLQEYLFPIQHDASLSRQDLPLNPLVFNQNRWNGILAYYKGQTNATIKQASLARYNRVKECQTKEPHCIYSPYQLILSYGESALYLSTMGDPSTGNAPLAYVNSLFEKERLPYELGWRKPAQETNFATLGAMIFQMGADNPEILPEGLSLGEGSLKFAFAGRDPLTGKLYNATAALLGLS